MKTYAIEIQNPTLDDLDNLTQAMSNAQDEMVKYTQQEAAKLGISENAASDVIYLRSRTRWTQKLEDELIALHKAGTPPNVYDFGSTPDNQAQLVKEVEEILAKENPEILKRIQSIKNI